MKTTFPDELEAARVTNPSELAMRTKRGDRFGLFSLRLSPYLNAVIVASDGLDGDGGQVAEWEHVSVRIQKLARTGGGKLKHVGDRTPTWEKMCRIKDLFWDEEECAMQFHPPRSEYVNIHPHVLHLWARIGATVERPGRVHV